MESDRYDDILRIMRETPKPALLDGYLQPYWPEQCFSEALGALMQARGIPPKTAFERALIDRSTGYKILSGARKPGRDIVLRLALALRLEPGEVQRLLRLANRGALCTAIRRDAAMLHCLLHHMTVDQAQEALIALDEAPLFRDE